MGETGKITRVANLFLGSPFTFASISEEQKTASGQLTVSEINIIKNIIRKV
jgi:3-dehydroquinate dehydratase